MSNRISNRIQLDRISKRIQLDVQQDIQQEYDIEYDIQYDPIRCPIGCPIGYWREEVQKKRLCSRREEVMQTLNGSCVPPLFAVGRTKATLSPPRCNGFLPVLHLLVSCRGLDGMRVRFLGSNSLTMVGLLSDHSVHISSVMMFIQKAQFPLIYQPVSSMTF